MTKKKKPKNKKPSKVWGKYSVKEGKIERKISCPRCGIGTFMAEHRNRKTCGKCGFSEFLIGKEKTSK